MTLELIKQKILRLFINDSEVFYINGSETLPPPLTKEEEQKNKNVPKKRGRPRKVVTAND